VRVFAWPKLLTGLFLMVWTVTRTYLAADASDLETLLGGGGLWDAYDRASESEVMWRDYRSFPWEG